MTKGTYLITGAAGFIGYHLSKRLLGEGYEVVGLDNLNNYYPREIKKARLANLANSESFKFIEGDITNQALIEQIFKDHKFDSVFHLAAQAGVRYSLENPRAYLSSNIDGTLNILEAARFCEKAPHLLIASSSSVYGLSEAYPFKETDSADRPAALYGATKRADELMAHSYSHLFGLRTTLLRFFTVYGPWGRPDMALFMFTKNILEGKPIEVFNGGDMVRDFTFVEDIVEGIVGLDRNRKAEHLPKYDVFNIGCAHSRTLQEFISAIEIATGKRAILKKMPFQPGDVYRTSADVSKLQALTGYQPKVQIEEGIARFVDWFRKYYSI